MSRMQTFRSRFIAAAAILCLAGTAQAQLSTATIKGKVSANDAAAPAGTSVTAVNKDSGYKYAATTKADGSYALTGLPPGEYEIRVKGPDGTAKSETVTLAVGDSANLDLALDKAKVEELVVVGARRKAVKTSEVGTNVSPKVIEALPAPTHNFLASADLAPGVAFTQDQGTGYTSIQAGSQSANNVNVFIDGVSQKNNILKGGVTGQDTSRGNPFPQSAIAEYKIITSNYKAEFDQVSSAAVSAVTISGTNDLHADLYYDFTGTKLRSLSPVEYDREQQGQKLQSSNKQEFGAALRGAIKEDVLHYVLVYDGKNINDSRQVVPQNLYRFSGQPGVVAGLAGMGGSYVDPFAEHLAFGKIDAQYASDKKLTATLKYRLESDRVPEDRSLSAHGNDKNRTNNELRIDAFHEWSLSSDWLATTRAGYQDAVWNPKSANRTPLVKWKVDTGSSSVDNAPDIIFTGGSPDDQKKGQSGFTLAQDATFTGLLSHVFKGGARVNFMKYDLSGTSRSVPVVTTLVDQSGNATWDGTNCVAGSIAANRCKIDPAIPATSVSMDNAQIGFFLQDDWAVLSNLELNLGLRWDYETNMLNNKYVTPADRVAALHSPDTRTVDGDIVAATPHNYDESLRMGGINIEEFISNGSSRKPFMYAFAPRIGFSYDVFSNRETVVFGGYGRSYDRMMASYVIDELAKNSTPGQGEIWLIKNKFNMPYVDQFSLGVRQGVGSWNLEVSVTDLLAHNQFNWFAGMRDPNGGWGHRPIFDPIWSNGGPVGYGSLVLGDFVGENKTLQVAVKLDKPYTKASGWSASLAYTYSDPKTKNNDWTDSEPWNWTYGRSGTTWHPSTSIDKHRLVAYAMADNLLPLGVVIASKVSYASGPVRRGIGCYGGFGTGYCTGGVITAIEDSPTFTQVDVALSRVFRTGAGAFTLRADVFNVFNTANYKTFNPWLGDGTGSNPWGGNNQDWNRYNDIRGPMRTLKLSGSYSF